MILDMKPYDKNFSHRWSTAGVVPVGTPILHHPIPELTEFDKTELMKLSDHMFEIMRDGNGIGLAANQVGVPVRLFVHGLKLKTVNPTIINPYILSRSGEKVLQMERCLSFNVEGAEGNVARDTEIKVAYQSVTGQKKLAVLDGYAARVFQHEIDHLDGIAYVQRLLAFDHEVVYNVLKDAGIDPSVMPPVKS